MGIAGDSSFDTSTGAYHIKGAGAGLTGTADAFHFAYYEAVRGDGQMIVRVSSADSLAQVALVLRESLDANAASAAVTVYNGAAQFACRTATGNATVADGSTGISVPCWLKLVRSGNTVNTFLSQDGLNWTALGNDTVTLGNATVYVGFAVSNGVAGANGPAMASFDSIQSTFLPNEGLLLWLRADAGVTQDGNGAVSTWADASGQGNDVLQATAASQPQWVDNVINGHPALRFDGNGDYLATSAPVSTAANNATVLAVVRVPDTNTQGTFIKNGSPNDGFGLGVGGGTFDSAGNDALALYEGLRWINGGTPWGVGTVLAEMTVDASGNPVMYRNGVLLGNFGGGAPRSATGSTGIGGYGGRFYRGDIAEVLMFNRALSDGQRQAWENYLNAKYQFTPPPAAPTQLRATPLSTSQATLVWSENSPTATGYTVERQNADGTWTVIATVGAGSTSYVDGSLAAGHSYAYRVTAFNSAGSSAYSSQADISTPATGSAPASVAAADALALWLRADAGITQDGNGSVSGWTDSSGHGNDAAQSDPASQPQTVAAAVNGQPVVRFDGSSNYLRLPTGFNDFSQGITALVVARPTGAGSYARFFDLGNGAGADNVLLTRQGTSNTLEFYSNNPGFELDAGGAIALDACQLFGYVQSAATATLYANGAAVASGGGTVLGNVSRTSNLIAKSNWSDDALFQGDLAEIVLFDRALTNAERQAWETYLNAKYQFNSPPTPPSSPAQLTVLPLSATQVALAWSEDSSGVSGYTVERQNADGTWTVIATVGGGITGYVDGSLQPGKAYTYRVTATNAAGSSPASAAATGAPRGSDGGAFPVAGLQLWLRADAGVTANASQGVSAWTDPLSGHVASQANAANCPTLVPADLNGLPALRFDGSSSYLDTNFTGAGGQELTLFVVAKGANYQSLVRFQPNGNPNYVIYPWQGSSLFIDSSDGGTGGGLPSGLVANQWNIGAAVYKSGDRMATYCNDGLVASRAAGGNALPGGLVCNLGRYSGGSEYLQADVAEVLVFNRALDDAERQAVESYLDEKYAIIAAPDAPPVLTGAAVSLTQASLLWQLAGSGGAAAGFAVERKLTGGADDFAEVAAIAGGMVSTYLDDGLAAGSSYTYRVRAWGLAGYSGYSPETVVAMPAGGSLPTSLPAIDDLALWLRADAGTTQDPNGLVSAWADSSGHGNNALQASVASQPQWVDGAVNGRPALRFDGNSDSLATAQPVIASNNNATILAVVRLPDASDHGAFVKNGLGNGFGFGVGSGTFDSPGNAAIGIYEAVRWMGGDSTWGVGTVLAEMTVDAAGNPALYRNGTPLGNLGAGAPASPSGPTFIGGYNHDTARFLRGDIAEVVMFDRVLTNAERQAWENYLNAKYQFTPPPTAPTQLSIVPLSASQIALSWSNGSSTVSNCMVERQNTDGTWSIVATMGVGISGYVDGSLQPGTAYTYRVTAANAAGSSPASAVAAGVTRGNDGGALPLAGLQLWLRADAGATTNADSGVGTWADVLHGHVASQANTANSPTLIPADTNGLPALQFNGANDYLDTDFAEAGGQELTFIVVAKGGNYQSLLRFQFAGGADYVIYPWSTNAFIDSADGGPSGGVASGLTTGIWNLGEVTYQSSGQIVTYCNGSLVASRAAGGNDLPAGLPFGIGHGPGGGEYLQADVAEVLVYNRALSDAERRALEHYFVARYALAAFLGGDPNADPDGDGLTNYQEYLAGTDPSDYYNGQKPDIAIVSGNNQPGAAGTFVSQPLRVKVTGAAGVPLSNAPVVFAVTRASGLLAVPAAPAALSSTVTARTDANGFASALFQAPADALFATSLVTATAGTGVASTHVVFAEAIVGNDDTSGDGLPDWWKLQYGFDLTLNNAAGDPDGDGLTNLQEFQLGTNPLMADATADGVPYTWALARGLDPRFDSLDAIDPNGNGLTYLQEYQLQQSTVDFWKFDEGLQGTATTSCAGYQDMGVFFGSLYWTADPDGGAALLFAHAGAQVDVASVTDGHLDFGATQSFSLTARFQTTGAVASRLVGKGSGSDGAAGYRLGADQGQVTAGIGGTDAQSPVLRFRTLAAFNDGQWHHAAVTFDRTASQACLYVDGILQPVSVDSGSVGVSQGTMVTFDPASTALSASRPDAVFAVGARDQSGAESFAGSIDNVGLFSKALTPAEVRSLAGNQGNTPPVVTISSPVAGAEFPALGTIVIQIQASSPTGSISKVECFDGAAKLGEASTYPYTVTWAQIPAGNHTLTARATDGRGASAVSAPVAVTVSIDSDHDGLPDWWELRYFGNLDQTAAGSYLNDGVSNLTKYQLGLDPTRPVTADPNNSTGLVVFTPLH